MPTETKRPTIQDVAKLAGVSIGSASNVLNRRLPVSDQLQTRVLAAAETLGFQINSVAQTLRRRSSRVLGFCTPDTRTAYLRELADSLDEIAGRNGYELVQVLTRQEPARELHCVNSLLSRQVDGLILLPSLSPQASLDAIARAGTPAVVVDRLSEDKRFSHVIIDNRSAMRQVVNSLARSGHRRLLFIAQNLGVITTRHRLAGLEEEARLPDVMVRYEVMERGNDEPAFVERVGRILKAQDPPTAIVTGNSRVAISTIRALQTLGLAWPRDVGLLTFEDPEWADILTPPISTVRTPNAAIAEAVWSSLESQMLGHPISRKTISILPDLIIRESSSRFSKGLLE
ncbi:MAG TPA: LacI family DNA-binding transcriptional regulator [Devosiaceae bacterium]|nr:LacI family DNA-binding transcriptional regulator [Devosiaceae bacterium]